MCERIAVQDGDAAVGVRSDRMACSRSAGDEESGRLDVELAGEPGVAVHGDLGVATTGAYEIADGADHDDLRTGDRLVMPAHLVDEPTFLPTERDRARPAEVMILFATDSERLATLRRADRVLAGTVTIAR
jgi:hypothetical protein